MKVAIIAFTKGGCKTAHIVERILSSKGDVAKIYVPEKFIEVLEELKSSLCDNNEEKIAGPHKIEKPSKDFYGRLFREEDALVFIGATGIAVREIAPFVRDKTEDPAVISMDEKGTYIIPLLSGHIGGANALAKTLAEAVAGTAVITTATDINGKFSVDAWAEENGFYISDMSLAKKVSSEILENMVVLISDFPMKKIDDKRCREKGLLPVYQWSQMKTELTEDSSTQGLDVADVKIYLSYKENPSIENMNLVAARDRVDNMLRLIPRILHLGIGCRKGTSKDVIKAAVEKVFQENNLDIHAIKQIASIDIKRDEEGIISLAYDFKVPFVVFDAEELKKVPGEYGGSDFVEQITGVDNVCQRAAMASALGVPFIPDSSGAHDMILAERISGRINPPRIIVKKTALNGVTISVAAEYLEVDLG